MCLEGSIKYHMSNISTGLSGGFPDIIAMDQNDLWILYIYQYSLQ